MHHCASHFIVITSRAPPASRLNLIIALTLLTLHLDGSQALGSQHYSQAYNHAAATEAAGPRRPVQVWQSVLQLCIALLHRSR
jgi:hypothetical protein